MPTLVGGGVYSIQEAARLIGADSAAVRRWAFGYERDKVKYEPIIRTELPPRKHVQALSFTELVELLFVKALLKVEKLSWTKLRRSAELARQLFRTEHPFALKKFFADPGGVYARIERETGFHLIELSGHGQIVMEEMLGRYLHQLDFNVDDVAIKWYPRGRQGAIVVDPSRAFGAPIVAGTSIETATLAALHSNGEESIRDLAWWYNLEDWQVEEALRFEAELRAP